MSLQLIGKKKGMTLVFDEKGESVACTIIEIEPNVVVQIKNIEKDGYQAVQVGAPKVPSSKLKNITNPLKGHYAKAQVEPRKYLKEFRIQKDEEYTVGQEIGIELLAEGTYVDVIGMTKGKGFQGVIKRHGFSGGPASHGSGFHRSAGSTGMRSTPGRTLPGLKMAGHMGHTRVTTQSLKIVRVDQDNRSIFVKGTVPGSKEGLVYVRKSIKK